MKKITLLAAIYFCIFFTKLHAQIGIGTATPNAAALLQVDAGTSLTKGLLITGTFDASATVPSLGVGSRLMFYPGKAAFRAGYVSGTQWDNASVGRWSVAMGANTSASAYGSTAMGYGGIASANYATAMGVSTTASGNVSTAMGSSTTASAQASTAMGLSTIASGDYSTAMGKTSIASGQYSTTMGLSTAASADAATAMGSSTNASGVASTAMGYNTTASENSSIAMGNSTTAIGKYSTTMGLSTVANADASTAMGSITMASGVASTAMGYSTIASGNSSTAMGNTNTASGDYSTAMGNKTTASGISSTVLGFGNTASADYSTAMGNASTASGGSSTAMGYQTNAKGNASTAMGYQTTASGKTSTAMGSNTTASAAYSTAMGYNVSTGDDLHGQGSLIIGDSDPNSLGITTSGVPDRFTARFYNGYYFITGDPSGNINNDRIGVIVKHNGNSWLSICDKNRKENFEPLNGEAVLQKLSNINFTSWNYKKQDPKTYRHYGIMAQDFNAAFGKDKYGTIGDDTTVNPIDMIGIDMAAIQALVKRTNELKLENETINKKLARVTDLEKDNENLRQSVAQLQTSFNEQQKLIAKSLQQMQALTQALALKQITKEPVAIK